MISYHNFFWPVSNNHLLFYSQLGAQIDGYGSPIAHTVVVGASAENPVTGAVADALKAAHTALEAAIRLIKPGNKNMDVTKAVGQITDAFGVKCVEGMLTHQQEKDVVDGKKQVK
jgi:methionine aminopeptidase